MEKDIYKKYAKLQSKFRVAEQKWEETARRLKPLLSDDVNCVLNDFGKCLVIDPALLLPFVWPPAIPTSLRHHHASNSALAPIFESPEEEKESSEQEKTAAKKGTGKENNPFESFSLKSESEPGTSSTRAPKRNWSQIYEGFSNLTIRADRQDDENLEPGAQRIKRYI